MMTLESRTLKLLSAVPFLALMGAMMAFVGCMVFHGTLVPLEILAGYLGVGMSAAALMVVSWRYRGRGISLISAFSITLMSPVVSHYLIEPIRFLPLGAYVQCMGFMALALGVFLWTVRQEVPVYCRFEDQE